MQLGAIGHATAAMAQGANGTLEGTNQHRDFAGKPCLRTEGRSRAHTASPSIFDHIMVVDNHCPLLIKVKICYYRTSQCVNLDVPSYARKEQFLGSFPTMSVFRYDVREQF